MRKYIVSMENDEDYVVTRFQIELDQKDYEGAKKFIDILNSAHPWYDKAITLRPSTPDTRKDLIQEALDDILAEHLETTYLSEPFKYYGIVFPDDLTEAEVLGILEKVYHCPICATWYPGTLESNVKVCGNCSCRHFS